MPLKDGRRTDKEALFIGHLASTGDATFAAMRAGYKDPTVQGWQKAHNPAIVESVRKAQVARMVNEVLPLAVDTIVNVLTAQDASNRDKLTAAQIALKYTLGQSDQAQDKDPADMTPAEIQARIDALRRAAADKARPVIDGQAQGVFD